MTPIDGGGLLRRLDARVRELLAQTGTPGAVVLVRHTDRELVRHSWGAAQTHDERGPLPAPVPMPTDALVDVASITKIAATTMVSMRLAAEGALELERPVVDLLPAFRRPDVRVRHLLEHRSGLPAWAPLFLDSGGPEQALAAICATPLDAAPGRRLVYSDLGMALLGACLERAGAAPLGRLAQELVFAPLAMHDTSYRPEVAPGRTVAATSTGNPAEARMTVQHRPDLAGREATSQSWWRPRTLVGEVNDANAAIAFEGVAGHAGLFSTAADLARLGTELLRAPRGYGAILDAEVASRFLAAAGSPSQGLGFWRRRIADSTGRDDPADDSVGHRGFTGCELLASPRHGLVLVVLTNRLHGGDPPPDHQRLWLAVLRTVLESLESPSYR